MQNNNKLEKSNIQDIIPLTPVQEGMLYHYLSETSSLSYHMQFTLELKGRLNIEEVEDTWNYIIKNNETLRSVFRWKNVNNPVQIILKNHVLHIDSVDYSGYPLQKREEEIKKLLMHKRQKRFDLENVPFEISVIKLEDQKYIMDVLSHHILYDGWSSAILIKEFLFYYENMFSEFGQSNVSKTGLKSYVKHLKEKNKAVDLVYWEQYLKGLNQILSFTPYCGVNDEVYDEGFISVQIPVGLHRKIDTFVTENNVTFATLFYFTWGVLLQKYNDSDDVVFGTTVSGRNDTLININNVVGMFINTIPLRFNYSQNNRIRDVILKVSNDLIARSEYENTSPLDIAKSLGTVISGDLFDTIFVIENYPFDKNTLSCKQIAVDNIIVKEKSHYNVTMNVRLNNSIEIHLDYNPSLYTVATMKLILSQYVSILEQITVKEALTLADISLASTNHEEDILAYSHEEILECSRALYIDNQYACRNAIVNDYSVMTYENMQKKVDCLAENLQRNCIVWNQTIGVCTSSLLDLVLSVLAVGKINGKYILIDPLENDLLISQKIMDYNIHTLITSTGLTDKFNGKTCVEIENLAKNIISDDLQHTLDEWTFITMPQSDRKPVERSVIRQVNLLCQDFNLCSNDVVLLKAEDCVENIFAKLYWCFTFGASLSLCESDSCDMQSLVESIYSAKATVVFLTPTTLQLFLNYIQQNAALHKIESLHCIFVSGEAVNAHIVRKFQKVLKAVSSLKLIQLFSSRQIGYVASLDLTDCNIINSSIVCKIKDNFYTKILDRNLSTQPVGATGELYIEIPHLTYNGIYSSMIDLSEIIVLDERSWFRTGELVKRLHDGRLMFVGSRESEAVIWSRRVLLRNIENKLNDIDGVSMALVLAVDERLKIYLKVDQTISKNETDKYVRMAIPDVISGVSLDIFYVDNIPLHKGGKMNIEELVRGRTLEALPVAIDGDNHAIEDEIINIWKSVLGRQEINRNQNFFDIGGDSLKLMKVHNMLQSKFHKEFSLMELFKYTTIKGLTVYMSDIITEKTKDISKDISKDYVLVEKHKEEISRSDVAIIGMAGKFPGAENIEEFWSNLKKGIESITFYTDDELLKSGIPEDMFHMRNYVKAKGELKDVEGFDAAFFDILPREAENMDPQLRILYECAWEAVENAGYYLENYDGMTGVYITASSNYFWMKQIEAASDNMIGLYQDMLYNERDFFATRIAYKMNAKGPAMTIQTACSSSLVAVSQAYHDLVNGRCDMALAGGVGLTYPYSSGYLYQEGMIFSPDGHCRAFDIDAKGTVAGNGVGIVLLKRLIDAIQDKDNILAVVKSAEINNDGNSKIGYTAPSTEGQEKVIRKAIEKAGVGAEDISYVETHGTGTPLGDRVEIEALSNAHGLNNIKCAIGSVKTNIGHLDAASGIAGFIKTVLQLKYKQLVPSLHFKTLNPVLGLMNNRFYVNTKTTEWKSSRRLRAGVSSFGMGGTNAHVILEEMPNTRRTLSDNNWHVCIFSANTSAALDKALDRFESYWEINQELNLQDIAYTLQVGRKEMKHRKAVVCKDLQSFKKGLSDSVETLVGNSVRDIVFMFPGQGLQYVQMGKELYEKVDLFRDEVDNCLNMLEPSFATTLKSIWLSDTSNNSDSIYQTAVTQPLLFIFEYALAKLLTSIGIMPSAMIGHSIGEYVAACMSGVLKLTDALKLVVARGRLMESTPEGAMLSVSLSQIEIIELFGETLAIAAVNGEHNCVVSGDKTQIEKVKNLCDNLGIKSALVRTKHAFHSEFMEGILDEYESLISGIQLNAPQIPYISNINGDWITTKQVTETGYWRKHIRETVRFEDGIRHLLEKDNTIFIEVGPGNALSSYVQIHSLKNNTHAILQTIRNRKEQITDYHMFLNTLRMLWQDGVSLQWPSFYKKLVCKRVPLPTYPFERTLKKQKENEEAISKKLISDSKKQRDISNWYYIPTWKSVPAVESSSIYQHNRNFVLFAVRDKLSEGLLAKILENGETATVVYPGSCYKKISNCTYQINPKVQLDYVKLFSELAEQKKQITDVIHLWTTDDGNTGSVSDIENNLDSSLYSLVYIAQECSKTYFESLSILVVSSGMHRVLPNDKLNPLNATMLGFIKICPVEYPNISCKSIDLSDADIESEMQNIVDALLSEIQLTESFVVAYRNKKRFMQIYSQVKLPAIPERISVFGEGGVYLVTGGLSGVGFEIFKLLASKLKAHFILLSRTEFPSKETWAELLADKDNKSEVISKISNILAIERGGSSVAIYSADVTDIAAMRQLVDFEESQHGKITGIVHAAGVSDYNGIIQNRSKQDIANVLKPKVEGTIVLDKIFNEHTLDFFILCSSIGNIATHFKFGQVAYNAANEFLDAYADYRVKKGQAATSVNWCDWNESGMSTLSAKHWAAILNKKEIEIPEDGITNAEGQELFYRLLQYHIPRVAISNIDLTEKIEKGKQMLSKLLNYDDKKEQVHHVQSRSDLIEEKLSTLLKQTLGIDFIASNENFIRIGASSLDILQVHGQLKSIFGIEITISDMYTYSTIRSLAEHIRNIQNRN